MFVWLIMFIKFFCFTYIKKFEIIIVFICLYFGQIKLVFKEMNIIQPKNKYVYISQLGQYSSVHDVLIGTKVIINDEEKNIEEIKVGDKVEFYYHGEKTYFSQVKYVGYSPYPVTCVGPDCIVQTPMGQKKVLELVIGDFVSTPIGFKEIKYILQTKIRDPINMRRNSNGLLITEYHPVKTNGLWIFPINDDSFVSELVKIEYVYSFGIENSPSLYVNNTEIIGLNHGIENDEVVTHPYFGTNKVIDDIERLGTNNNGHCIIEQWQIKRDSKTGLICGIE